jgi:hypothetical protein
MSKEIEKHMPVGASRLVRRFLSADEAWKAMHAAAKEKYGPTASAVDIHVEDALGNRQYTKLIGVEVYLPNAGSDAPGAIETK